jgi:hypothetical protein
MTIIGHSHEEISQLEARIETLSDSVERCRKIALASKLVVAAGTIWILLMFLGVLAFAPINIVGSIAALLGGIVVFGSNASTRKQNEAAIEQAQMLRRQLIEQIEMRLVGEQRTLH